MIVGRSTILRRPAEPALPALAVVLTLAFLTIGIGALVYTTTREGPETRHLIESPAVYFAPGGSPTAAVVAALNGAKQSVQVQAYSFTSAPIAQALVAAEKRGVWVEAILDKSNRNAQYSAADFLAHGGVPTFIDAKHAIAHNKIIIIDDEEVLTGSFNFTRAAEEKNAENLLVLHDAELARQYERNWQIHLSHSEAYFGR